MDGHSCYIDLSSCSKFAKPKVFTALIQQFAEGYSEGITSFNVLQLVLAGASNRPRER